MKEYYTKVYHLRYVMFLSMFLNALIEDYKYLLHSFADTETNSLDRLPLDKKIPSNFFQDKLISQREIPANFNMVLYCSHYH